MLGKFADLKDLDKKDKWLFFVLKCVYAGFIHIFSYNGLNYRNIENGALVDSTISTHLLHKFYRILRRKDSRISS